MYLDFVFDPIRELAERYNVLQAAMAAAERIFGVLDTPTEDSAPSRPAPPDAEARGEPPAVEFRGVSFSYPNGPPVLQDVSFRVRRGQRVAVVGHTGAGKTTLVSLLCRFHETAQGSIRLHGRDVRGIPHRELRRHIAIVQQDVFLFSDTVEANIRMGDTSMSVDRLQRAAEAVHADAFVRRLPQGYGTRLAERGANLSSGQRQLLAFARALAADPDVLVLDEATSSVDSETEALVEDATRTLLAGRTALVIAHRLSTVVTADRILVMHKGRVHEEGTHDELLRRRGLYWRLYRLHLAGDRTEAAGATAQGIAPDPE
jgi:ABC-type multidrug transport system fused ATPase/permease subunit